MLLMAKVESIDRDIDLFINQDLSPKAQSATLAAFAREKLAEGEDANASILGRTPGHKTTVDGTRGKSEDNVRPDGTIVYEFELWTDLFKFVAEKLQEIAPVGDNNDPHPGLYQRSFTLYADGTEVDVGGTIPSDADEYVFMNTTPYANKIEGNLDQGRAPSSPQAPDGVFQAVAELAKGRYGNQAKIEFNYRAPFANILLTGSLGNKSENRVPCIVIKLR